MKNIIIAGAGHMGIEAARMINLNKMNLIGFADNDEKKQNTFIKIDGLYDERCFPVMSVKAAVEKRPDIVMIAIMGEKREESMHETIMQAKFDGEIVSLQKETDIFDIRGFVLKRLAARIEENEIDGAVAEVGVYNGDFSRQMNTIMPERKLYLFDTFNGFDKADVHIEKVNEFSLASENDFKGNDISAILSRLTGDSEGQIKKAFLSEGSYEISCDNVIIRKGYFPCTAKGLEDKRFALVSLDADLYAPTFAGLEFFYPRVNSGGYIIVHDYFNERFRGVRKAVFDYEKLNGRMEFSPLGDLHGSIVISKRQER